MKKKNEKIGDGESKKKKTPDGENESGRKEERV